MKKGRHSYFKRVYTPVPHECVRCWHCCLDADYKGNKALENRLPVQWLRIDTLAICPFLTVNGNKPSCLIYLERPFICRMYHCEIQQSAEMQFMQQKLCVVKQRLARH